MKHKFLLLLVSLLALACSSGKSSGVGEFLGMRFGVQNTHTVKDGPRGPPIFQGDMQEFYEIQFPNQEFEFVGIALTKNTDELEKEGVIFEKEGMIWGAFFYQKTNCTKDDFKKTNDYIKKGRQVINESDMSKKIDGTDFYSSLILTNGVIWQVSCDKYSRTVAIRDLSVLENASNAKGRQVYQKAFKETQNVMSRKMD